VDKNPETQSHCGSVQVAMSKGDLWGLGGGGVGCLICCGGWSWTFDVFLPNEWMGGG